VHGLSAAVHGLSAAVLAASTLVGITTSVILFCSHFHQTEGDIAAGKRSPVVKLGLPLATKVRKIII
jgi:1,4-dihydroxy-2-naphthoate octaprenyltransferase